LQNLRELLGGENSKRAKNVLGMATRFPSGRKSNAERERLTRARATEAPEWPRGATGELAAIARS
jgi:hypothetical protein